MEDLRGRKFNFLTFEFFVEKRKRVQFWQCLCDCGKKVLLPPYPVVYGTTKSCGCKRRFLNAQAKTGNKNPNWKGDKIGYYALHAWVKKHFPKPAFCVKCNLVPPKDAANISQQYKRDLSDWMWLCRKCHARYDSAWRAKKKTRKLCHIDKKLPSCLPT